MPKPPVSIVVPTYGEAQNIPLLARRVFETLRAAEIPAEMIFVDDNSRDGTEEAVAELAREFPVRLIARTNERGLSSAVVRGFSEARYDILLCMDADLSHPPEALPSVIAPIADGRADFCIGSRYTAGGRTKDDWGLLRQINSQVATLLARPLTSIKDPMAGFFCLGRATLAKAQAAGLNPIGYKIGLEILIKARCKKATEVPIEFSDRLHGRSKLTFKQQVEYLRHLWRLYRFRWPLALPLGIVAVIFGVVAPLVYKFLR